LKQKRGDPYRVTPLRGCEPYSSKRRRKRSSIRLVNDPPSAREINPEISVEMQEILYRAMERDPENRFVGAREFAAALAHPETVEVIDRSARKERKPARLPFLKRILSYTMLLIIPVVIFTLLLLVARMK